MVVVVEKYCPTQSRKMGTPKAIILWLLLSASYECCRCSEEEPDELYPEDGCKLVKDGCYYNAYCRHTYKYIDFNSMQVRNENECDNVIHYPRNNYLFLPTNVIFIYGNPKPFAQNNDYNGFYYNRKDYYESPNVLVESIDFTYNSYFEQPDISQLTNLKIFNMSHNMLEIVQLSSSENLEKLQEIDFSYNSVQTIDVRTEEHPYRALKILNLAHNSFTVIPDDIFYHFVKLQHLDLSHNAITNLNNMPFVGLKQMIKINLSYNYITSLSQSLAKLYNLKELYLQGNKLNDIQRDDISSLKLINYIDLSNNNIENIEPKVFDKMTQLRVLNLRNNNLKSLQKEMFPNSDQLEFIDLSQNEITKLPAYVFKQKNITHFSISENNLEGSLTQGVFDGLNNVEKLDLSYQSITAIENFAFYGVRNAVELLLNDNQIIKLSNRSFELLTKLRRLDLSNNSIASFNLNTEDLISLEYLSLRYNKISHLESKSFKLLNKLEFLDVSNNVIVNIEPNSFSLQPFLKVLLISNNLLQGSLSQDTFSGLQALPALDLSFSLLTSVSNGSFDGMELLASVNMSHSLIRDISYNAFINTGNIEILDMSHNKLINFNINVTELIKLTKLIIRRNLIQTLQDNIFKNLTKLRTLDLSCNNLLHLGDNTFSSQVHLELLDVSYNFNLTWLRIMKPIQNLKVLKISGTKANITFNGLESTLLDLEVSNANVSSLSDMKIGKINSLSNLVLSHNTIANLAGDFVNMSNLKSLDLSYNKIQNLQPGSFIGCTNLIFINMSHNLLTNINYGISHGLLNLHTLDVSYNLLESLEDDKFYQMHNLNTLIVDYNKISSVTIEQFLGTSLQRLSIGGNPLECKELMKLNGNEHIEVTAIVLDLTRLHNYNGISCEDSNKKYNLDHKNDISVQSNGYGNILADIKNILKDFSVNTVKHDDWVSLSNILTNYKLPIKNEDVTELHDILRNFTNQTIEGHETNNKIYDEIKKDAEKTNVLLERILKVVVAKSSFTTSLPLADVSNETKYNMVDLKNLENNFILEKERIVSEFDEKILELSKKIQENTEKSGTSPTFIDVCVVLILLILISCISFYFYKTQVILGGRRSASQHHITVDMDNSNL